MKFLFLSDKQINTIKHALGIAERSYSGLQEQYAHLERVRGNNIDKVDIRLHDKACEFADVNLDIDKLLDKKKGSSSNQGIAALKAMLLQLENDAERLASEHSDPTKGEDAWQGKHEVYGRYMAATEYAAGIRRTLEKL